ncbi:RNA polymerase sigma-70 factor [Brevibacillus centrosporus]|uniref:RNA polymerase sigma-70 factor, ECF subfamily n=1 Tax=Brevibacillus centrosporus TaxID=54910 RepID=A0A1I3QIY0_9BACL|nr:RNA polymerase sigma-70 factor [Brevibacillus centrosporus]SFJ33512.1 RNA polymerase sigma-70 factor, ECF subfamily [Brevibacillus centrosporus]
MTRLMEDVYRQYKSLMFSLAYRMLGSVAEAEDIVQETFLALTQSDIDDIQHIKSYLCKAVTNRCLDTMKSARWKREQYVGEWLPEPLADDATGSDPLHSVLMEESVSYGLLVLLETLSPDERVVYVLRTALGYEYSTIAEILNKSEAACRKLLSRAQQKLNGACLQVEVQPERSKRLVEKLISAISHADSQALVQLLSEDAVLISDGGGKTRAALHPIFSDQRIVAFLTGIWRKWEDARVDLQIRSINGQPGLIVAVEGQPIRVISLVLNPHEDRIERIYFVVNPEKLTHFSPKA